MKKIAFILSSLMLLCAFGSHLALAGYKNKYVIRIINSTKHKIKVKHAKYQIKGSGKEACHKMTGKKIKKGKSKRCGIGNALGQRKKHRWFVAYTCNGKKYRHRSSWFIASSTHFNAETRLGIHKCGKASFYGP